MPEANAPPTDDVEENTGVPDPSRRTILRGAAATGALLLGAGTATGNGRGGQAVVETADFEPDEPFTIVDGPFEKPDDRIGFQCNGQGREISFPYWEFTYEGDSSSETRKLYTRDNQIATDVTYRWTGQTKDCGEYVQTGFSAGGT